MPLPALLLGRDECNELDVKPGFKHDQRVLRFVVCVTATWSEGEGFGERWWGVDKRGVWEEEDYVVDGWRGGHGWLGFVWSGILGCLDGLRWEEE